VLSHQKQNCLTDIDARIQEILLRSSPVNDNMLAGTTDGNSSAPHPFNTISVVGNNNVVISTSLWMLLLLGLLGPWMNVIYLFLSHK
jgi:hypothetical protein